ncbi:TPA: hypothetical protein ACH3X2_010895 [Trebouxia sp. C0005]
MCIAVAAPNWVCASIIAEPTNSRITATVEATPKHGEAKAHHSLSDTSPGSVTCSPQAGSPGLVPFKNGQEDWLQSQVCQQMGCKTQKSAKGSENEQHHKAPEEERAAAPHSKIGAKAESRTKVPHKGAAKNEYTNVLRDHFIPEGNQMFAHAGKWAHNWKMPQNNAPPHKTATNMAFIADHVPAVTGTYKLAQKYINPKAKRALTGVGSKEYNDVLQQYLILEGKRLFQQAGRRADKWKLQQDNAPAHTTKENIQCISDNVPGGLFLEWPPTHLICLGLDGAAVG